ncbi:MAG: superoxide dismutase [Bacteroidaceae bacterium]|jgi:Fe-Mn family superoxide dismutase|nr:superoxide dismutase [Bacteroidaceae bacterium]MBR5003160.1 superoxide dismutase [Bacteroidaceae bacterium]
MKYTLPVLPYEDDALEPIISRETIEVHYRRHEQNYLNKLNDMIAGTRYEDMLLTDIIRSSEASLFNNAAQAWNHIFYFKTFSPNAQHHPKGRLADAINRHWETFENFCDVFVQMGTSLFGSGWVWLCSDENGHLHIRAESNAGNPLVEGLTPLLAFDVWEHAYYIDYRNRRDDHLRRLWQIVDWRKVEERYNF